MTARTSNSFSWLHLTELHCGFGPDRWLWPNVREQLFEDLARLHERSGPWSLVLFTGDLTQRGSVEDFRRLDESLDELWQHLGALGPPSKLLVVPGNHDLARPAPSRAEVKAPRHWDKDTAIREDFWMSDPLPAIRVWGRSADVLSLAIEGASGARRHRRTCAWVCGWLPKPTRTTRGQAMHAVLTRLLTEHKLEHVRVERPEDPRE